MSDPPLKLPLESTFDPKGTDAALRALRQLQQEQGRAQPRSGETAQAAAAQQRLATETAKTAVANNQAAVAAQRLATEEQRTAQAAGQAATANNQAAVAAQRLATEEQRTAAASAQAAAAHARAETANLRLAQAQDKAAAGAQSFSQQLAQGVQSGLMGIVGPAALATAALGAISKGGELIELGAQAQQTRGAFNNLAATAGTTGDVLLAALRKASGGTISDLNLQLAANRAQLLGVADSAQEFSTLMEIARDRAQQMGISTTQAFNDLVTGLGRGSALILDNLGITVSVAEANEAYAASLGKTVGALSEAEQKQALINAVLAQGAASLEATGGAAETTAAKLERASASIENAKAALGGLLAIQAAPVADDIAKVADAATGATDAMTGLQAASATIGDAFGTISPALDIIDSYNQAVLGGARSTLEWAGVMGAAASEVNALAEQAERVGGAMDDERHAAAAASSATSSYADVQSHLASEHAAGGRAADQVRAAYGQLREELEKLSSAGASALEQSLATQTQFADRIVAAQTEAQDKITALQTDRAAVRTAKERAAIDERITAVQAGLNRELIAQAEAYAAQEAAQREHLGKQLIEYARAQAELNGVSAAATQELTQRIAAEFGVQESLSDRTFSAMSADIAAWAQSGGQNTAALAGQLDQTTDQAADLARAMDEAEKERRIELVTDFQEGRIRLDELTEALANVPAEIATQFQDDFPNGTRRAQTLEERIRGIERQIRTEYGDNFPVGVQRAMLLDGAIAEIPKAISTTADDNLDQVTRHARDAKRAIDNIPTHKTVTVDVVTNAAAGVGGGAAPPSDDEDGGPSPSGASPAGKGLAAKRVAGAGGGSVEAAIQTLTDATEIIKVIKPFVAANRGAAKLLSDYSLAVKSAVASLIAIQDLRARLVEPQPILDPEQVKRLKADVELVLNLMVSIDASANKKSNVFAKYLVTEKAAIDILDSIMELRRNLSAPTPPITPAYVLALVATANAVIGLLFSQLIPLKQREVDGLKNYAEAAGAGVGILSGLAELRKDLAEQKDVAPFNLPLIHALMKRAAEIVRLITTQLVPLTEQQAAGIQAYAEGVGAAVDALSSVAELRKDLADQANTAPLNMRLVKALAARANEITQIVLSQLVPLTEQQGEAFSRYAEAAQAAVATLKDTADLRKELAGEKFGALPMAAINTLAADTRRITEAVVGQMLPLSEEQAAAARRFAETEGAAVAAIKDVLGLSGEMFADYQSPSDAQLDRIVADADRIAKRLNTAAAKYSTEGLEAAKAYGEALGSIFSAFKEELLFAHALQSDDFILDPKRLAAFEAGGKQIIHVANRLGGAAAALPAGNLAALNGVSEAISAQSDMWLKLASVPFGNLSQLAAGAAGAPGGGGGIGPITINIYAQPGQDARQIGDAAIGRLSQLVGMRRT